MVPDSLPVQHLGAVAMLEPQAEAFGDDEGDHRHDEERDAYEPGDRVDGQMQMCGHDVVAAADQQDRVQTQPGHAERGAGGDVAGPVQDVVLAFVPGDPRLDERVDADRQHDQREEGEGDEDAQRQGVAEGVDLPSRHHPDQPLGEAEIPVGLGAGGDQVGAVGAEGPYGVDRGERAHHRQHAEDQEEEAAGLGHVDRHERHAHHGLLVASWPGVLRVLVVEDQDQVSDDQAEHDPGQQQNMDRVQPGDDLVPRELSPEEEEGEIRAHDRHGQDRALREAEAGAGEQVVGERVAGQAGDDAEEQQGPAEQPSSARAACGRRP